MKLGMVAFVIVAVLAVVLGIGDLPARALAAVISVTLLVFVLTALAFSWRHWAKLLGRDTNTRVLVIEFLAAPFRRLRVWVAAMCLAFLAFIVFDHMLPWLFVQARALPTQIEADLRAVVASEALSDLQVQFESETQLGDRDASDAARCRRSKADRIEWLRGLPEKYKGDAERQLDYFSDARAGELGKTLMRVVSLVLAITCARLILGPVVLIGARGRRVMLMAAAALLPLPTLFILDLMGVTSAVPWLWVGVYAPFAVADAALSTQPVPGRVTAYWMQGRMTLHSNPGCPALSAISSSRIQQGEWVLLIRLGFRRCQRCARATALTDDSKQVVALDVLPRQPTAGSIRGDPGASGVSMKGGLERSSPHSTWKTCLVS